MKPMSLLLALFFSVIVLSIALWVGNYTIAGGISYGWLEHFYAGNYYLYGALSSFLVLIGGICLTSVMMRGSMYGSLKSHLPLLLYSSVMALAVGNKFLFIAIAGLYVVFAFLFVVSNCRNPEPISGFIFKMVLILFILALLHPAMIWLLIPFAGIIVYFRSSAWKELSVLILSSVFFSAIYLWCSWFFGYDISVYVCNMWPEFSFCSSSLSFYVAIGMLILILFRWSVFKKAVFKMDVLICKMEQYSVAFVIFMSLLLIVLGCEWLIPLLAVPISIIIYIHYESLNTALLKFLLIFGFFLVIVTIGGFMLCPHRVVLFLDDLLSVLKQFLV